MAINNFVIRSVSINRPLQPHLTRPHRSVPTQPSNRASDGFSLVHFGHKSENTAPFLAQLNDLVQQVKAIDLQQTAVDDPKVMHTVQALQSFATNPTFDKNHSTLLNACPPDTVRTLREFYAEHVSLKEKHIIRKALEATGTGGTLNLLSLDDPITLNYVLSSLPARLKEARDLQLAGKNVVFIGSGPFPISMMVYAMSGAAHITGLDIDAESIELSRKAVEALPTGLREKITILNQPGETYDYNQADLVVMAVMAKPKPPIFEQIFKTRKNDDIQVLARSAKGMSALLYDTLAPKDYRDFVRIQHGFKESSSSKTESFILQPITANPFLFIA